MPQSNIYALTALASFLLALFVARIVVRIQKGEYPGGALWVVYLRMLLGFLLAGAVIFGMRSFGG